MAAPLCCPPEGAAETIVVNKNAPTAILENGFGYNTRFPDTVEPWETGDGYWTAGLRDSFAGCFRYPGGTVGNFWNAGTNREFSDIATADPDGWVNADMINLDPVQGTVKSGTMQVNTLPDLAVAVKTTGAVPLFVLNFITPGRDFYASAQGWNRAINDHPGIAYDAASPDDWYRMLDDRYRRTRQMLIEAHESGIPIERIELGNEYYLAATPYYSQAFPDGVSYATAANYLAAKLRSDPELSFLPEHVLISVPGASEEVGYTSTRILNWNQEMVPNLDRNLIDFITLHSYEDADPGITAFDNNNVATNAAAWLANIGQALGNGSNGKKTTQYILKGTANDGITWKVWWNELSPKQASGAMKGHWGSVLLQVFAALWAVDNNAALFEHPNFDGTFVLNSKNGALKSIGRGMAQLMQAANRCSLASHLNFPGAPNLATSVRTILQGQYFENAGGSLRNCCIVNFSPDPFTLDMSAVFEAAPELIVSGEYNTDPDSGNTPIAIGAEVVPAGAVTLRPFSITVMRPASGTTGSFADWQLINFPNVVDRADPTVGGAEATPAGDGVTNLMKYALDLPALVPLASSPIAVAETTDSSSRLQLRFRREWGKADLVYIVEASGDLMDWNEVVYHSIQKTDTAVQSGGDIVVTDPRAVTTASRRFLRLRVEQMR